MSASPYIYYREVAAEKLAAVVDEFKAELKYLYLESEATIELTAYTRPDPNWSHGRAFGQSLEIRWQMVPKGFEMLLLTETERQLANWTVFTADTAGWAALPDTATPSQTLLWGTHLRHLQQPHRLAGETGDAWIETRIPRPLRYPVADASRYVKAQVMIYRCQERPILTRLVGLEGENNESEPIW